MAKIQGGTFRTVEALGQSIIDQVPGLSGRDPEEIGEKAIANPKYSGVFIHSPQDFSEIDLSMAAKRAPGDFGETAWESLEGLGELARHPIDTGVAMAKLAGSGAMEITDRLNPMRVAQNPLLGLISRMNISEEDREGAREFGREVKKSVSPEGIQERPALALSNVLMAVPGGAGVKGASAGGRFGKALGAFKKARNIVDPSELPITTARFGGRVGKEAIATGGRASSWIGKKAFESVKGFADAIRSSNASLSSDLFAALLGFTTGRGPRFIREMIRKGSPEDSIQRQVSITDQTGRADPGTVLRETGPDVQREFRSMDQADAERIIATRALEAVDRFKDGMNASFDEALSQLPLGEPIEITLSLRRQAQNALNDMGVKVKGAEAREITPRLGMTEVEELSRREAGQPTIGSKVVSTGEGQLIFPDFGDSPGTTTTISAQGGGRNLMTEAFLRLINAPEAVTMGDLMNFRRSIDDALGVASSDVSGEARVALGRLRQIVADELGEVPGYLDTMGEYEEASTALHRMTGELDLVPGALTKAGEIRGPKTSTIVNSLMRTLSESGPETPFAALQELQRKGGDESITSALVGAGSKPLAGTGLVVKSELSQAARIAASTLALGGSMATFWKVPAAVMFSPRAVNEILLRALDPDSIGGTITRGAGGLGAGFGKAKRAAQKAQQVQRLFQKANQSSGGELAKMAAKEGWTIGQLFERLQISTGVEFEEGDLAKSPKASTFMKTIGGIGRTPPAG